MPKSSLDHFAELPVGFPGREVLGLPKLEGARQREEYSCATLWASVPNKGTGGTVRVNLWAELLGQRTLVASAFVAEGFVGLVVSAAGIQCDRWEVSLQATDPRLEGHVGLRADGCCSEFKVFVPPTLQQPPSFNLPPDFLNQAPAPLEPEGGTWFVATDADGNVIGLDAQTRVVGLTARNGAGLGTISILSKSGAESLITLEPGDAFRLDPKGLLVGPGNVTFGGTMLRWVVELVR